MATKVPGHRLKFSWLVLAAAGMVFGSSCSFAELQAFSTGISAAASSLNQPDENPSFTDWLSDELRDL